MLCGAGDALGPLLPGGMCVGHAGVLQWALWGERVALLRGVPLAVPGAAGPRVAVLRGGARGAVGCSAGLLWRPRSVGRCVGCSVLC